MRAPLRGSRAPETSPAFLRKDGSFSEARLAGYLALRFEPFKTLKRWNACVNNTDISTNLGPKLTNSAFVPSDHFSIFAATRWGFFCDAVVREGYAIRKRFLNVHTPKIAC